MLLATVAVPPEAAAQTAAADARLIPWAGHIREASLRFGVPERWIMAVMLAESRGVSRINGRPITSSAGAIGLMQVMPATYAALAAQLGLGSDPADPRDNILAGTAYLRMMADQFGVPGFLAAYNAGPGRYGGYLRGRPLPLETRRYVHALSVELGFAADGLTGRAAAPAPQMARANMANDAGPPPIFTRVGSGDGRLFFTLTARSEKRSDDGVKP